MISDTKPPLSDSANTPIIHDNVIGFNNLRGTETQIVLTPESLESANKISRYFVSITGIGYKIHPSSDPIWTQHH